MRSCTENEEGTSEKMAVMAPTGQYLPRGLTFGPTNGPEDFQELVFIVFCRSLYHSWYLFLDDLTVATGRNSARNDAPSKAHDVMCSLDRSLTDEEKSKLGLTCRAGSGVFKSPMAHVLQLSLLALWFFAVPCFLLWCLLVCLACLQCANLSLIS